MFDFKNKINFRVFFALAGNLFILALMFLPTIVFGAVAGTGSADPTSALNNAVAGTGLETNKSVAAFAGGIIVAILGALGLLLMVLIVYAGVLWVTSQGEAAKVKKAQDLIKQAVIGIIIVFSAYALEQFVVYNLEQASKRQ